MSNRRLAREVLVQSLYETQLSNVDARLALRSNLQRRNGGGRRCVAPLRFKNNFRAHPDVIDLLGDRKPMALVAHDKARITRTFKAADARCRRLQHRLLVDERK